MCNLKKILRPVRALLALAITFITIATIPSARAVGTLGVYVGSEYYAPTTAWQNTARSSGYTSLYIFTLNVETNGNLTAFGTTLAQNGTYTGDSTWGAKLAACKAPPSTVNRIEICIGSWGSQAFNNIKNLIASQGTGTGSILYKNFLALKNATGVDAIQFDDELTYDVGSMVAFGNMLAGMGLKVTLCPYTQQAFWVNVKSQLGTKVDAIYLQCYDGGSGNDPANWISAFGGFKVTPGLWGNTETLASATSKMLNWRKTLGIPGGFMWLNGTMQWDYAIWPPAFNNGAFALPAYFMLVNKNSGKCIDLIGGNTADGAPVRQFTYDYNGANQRWMLQRTENWDHFKIVSVVSGKCLSFDASNLAVSSPYTANNAAQQFDLVDGGNGWYKIKNVASGKVLDVVNWGISDNANITQFTDGGTQANQMFRLQPWGTYNIGNKTSSRYINVSGAGTANGSTVIQWNWENNMWFKWRFNSTTEGLLTMSPLNSINRVISVWQGSTVAAQYTVIWDFLDGGDQKMRLRPLTDGTYKLYFSHDGMSWDIPGGQTGNSVPLEQYPNNANEWQKFYIERAP